MPEWIDKRQQHLRAKNPEMPESEAWAVATQQAHAAGKSPKGYGTPEGRHESKAKYDEPKKEYEKAPDPGGEGAEKFEKEAFPMLRSPLDLGVVTGFSAELQEIEKQAGLMELLSKKVNASPAMQDSIANAVIKGAKERYITPHLGQLEKAKKYGLPAALVTGGLYAGHKIHQGVKRRRELQGLHAEVADLRQQLGVPDPRGRVGMQALDDLYKEATGGAMVPATPASIKPASAKQAVTGRGRIIPTSTPQPPSGGAAEGFRQIPPSATEATQRPSA